MVPVWYEMLGLLSSSGSVSLMLKWRNDMKIKDAWQVAINVCWRHQNSATLMVWTMPVCHPSMSIIKLKQEASIMMPRHIINRVSDSLIRRFRRRYTEQAAFRAFVIPSAPGWKWSAKIFSNVAQIAKMILIQLKGLFSNPILTQT